MARRSRRRISRLTGLIPRGSKHVSNGPSAPRLVRAASPSAAIASLQMPIELDAETLHYALARLEEWDHVAAVDARASLSWFGWDEEGPLQLRRYDLQLHLWYELPTKVSSSLEHKRSRAAALGRLLDMTPAAGYAPLCREPETLEQIALWETNDARARRALARLLDASGIEPPDTPLLAWSSIMGLVEAQAREEVAYELELALEAGRLTPGTAGFKRRQAEIVADVLMHEDRLESIHAERLQSWRDDHRSPTRTAIIDRVADTLARPSVTVDASEAVAVARWLLDRAVDGIALTQTGALNRALVREAVELRPDWWDTALFGPPNREDEIVPLARLHNCCADCGCCDARAAASLRPRAPARSLPSRRRCSTPARPRCWSETGSRPRSASWPPRSCLTASGSSTAPSSAPSTPYSRIVFVGGARQVGKTTVVGDIAAREQPMATFTLDDQATREAAISDPTGFVGDLPGPAFIDEIHRAPDLLLELKKAVDADTAPGQFVITGSANVLASRRIQDALPGRIDHVDMWPLAQSEIHGGSLNVVDELFDGRPPRVSGAPVGRSTFAQAVSEGGYPEARLRPAGRVRDRWFANYIAATLARDLTELADVRRFDDAERLLRLLATQSANLLSYRNVGTRLGMHHDTVQAYVALLEQMFLVTRLPAWRPGLGAREAATPKLHVCESGLLASWSEQQTRIYNYQRDREDVDVVLENNRGEVVGIEVKAAATLRSADWKWLKKLAATREGNFKAGIVVYAGDQTIPLGSRLWAMPYSGLWS